MRSPAPSEVAGLPTVRFIGESGVAGAIAALVEPALADLGLRLVRVRVTGRDGKTVQIMAERPDGTMTIEDCETASRQLSPLLDAHDLVAGSFRLEISSPGIDRPLVRASDFGDWAGHEARIELSEPVRGRKRFRGKVGGYANGEVLLEIEQEGTGGASEVLGLPIALVTEAKLVLTDELVRRSLRRSKHDEGTAGPVSRPDVKED